MEATIQKNEEIESLRAQLTKTEEKSRRDQMELKRLKDEIQRLKFLVNESPGTNSESGQQNRNIPSGMESVTQNTTPPDSNSTVKLPSTYGLRAASEPSSLTPLSPSGYPLLTILES
jgi:septal ring factor EnvC (AmiA/AmiB activator)